MAHVFVKFLEAFGVYRNLLGGFVHPLIELNA